MVEEEVVLGGEGEDVIVVVVGGLGMVGSRRGRIRLLRGLVGDLGMVEREEVVEREVERRRRGSGGRKLGWGFGNLSRPL